MVPGSHLIASDIVTWRRVILSLACALIRCVLLVVKMSLRAWLCHRV
jgi:cell division protein FtsL